jgi:hypothetical protein
VRELSSAPYKTQAKEEADQNAVGKIDEVLVNAEGGMLQWCALEFQAVYFSGKSMENDFKGMREWTGLGVPFPKVQRRPDFRSSGPKRRRPQLQIKLQTIRRSESLLFCTALAKGVSELCHAQFTLADSHG